MNHHTTMQLRAQLQIADTVIGECEQMWDGLRAALEACVGDNPAAIDDLLRRTTALSAAVRTNTARVLEVTQRFGTAPRPPAHDRLGIARIRQVAHELQRTRSRLNKQADQVQFLLDGLQAIEPDDA